MPQLFIFKILGIGFTHQKKLLRRLAFLILVYNIVELIFPKIFQVFVDLLRNNQVNSNANVSDWVTIENIWILPIILILISIVKWQISYKRIQMQAQLGHQSLQNLRSKIYEKINALSFKFHDGYHSGNLISNIVEDIRFVNQFLEAGLFPFFETAFYIVAAYAYIGYICWPAALICFSLQLIMIFFSYGILNKSYVKMLTTKESFSDMVESFSENMEGHLVNRSLGLNDEPKKIHFKKIDNLHSSIHKETLWTIIFHQSVIWCAYLNICIGVFVGLYLYQNNWNITVGEIFILFYLLNSLVSRVRINARAVELFVRSVVTATRLKELLTSQENLSDNGKYNEVPDGDIYLEDCVFSYNTNAPVIDHIDAKILKNKFTALVGFTGSGKSTLLHLLCRHYDPNAGEIKIGDTDLKKIKLASVRANIGPVFQETFVFNATIRENISFGMPNATLEEIKNCAKVACIHDFISTLPNGYETEVGERGVSLSGGQKQRLGISRALLKKPKILVMDDCTSALDAKTEAQIIKNLSVFRKNQTTLYTTQRLNGLSMADEILVMDQFKIKEKGSFQELFKEGNLLFKIFSPFKKQEQ